MRRSIPFLGSPRRALLLLLLISLGLRLAIIFRGGQYFWADESRYGAAASAWDAWYHGHRHEALLLIAGTADHLGFKALMLAPAWLQIKTGATTAQPACLLALFSVANIFWVWLLARRMGADEREALWSAAAMAAAASMFYWTRHLMPYDVALFWALACTYVAVKPRPGFLDSWLAGILGFAAFVTYNGYWVLVACALTTHVLLALPGWLEALKRAFFGLLGLAGTFLLMLFGALHFGIYLLVSYLDFSGSINQGDFREGHIVFFDYLWQVEHLTALIWVAALLAFGWLVLRAEGRARRRGGVWIAIIVAVAIILVVGSNVMETCVVYGRLARQVVPFCALLTGWTAAQLFRGRAPWGRVEQVALAVMLAGGGWSLSVPLRQEFPATFHRKEVAAMEAYRVLHAREGPVATAPGRFRLLYDGFLWPDPGEPLLPAHYETLLASPHPLAWRPYLYEGFNHEQRKKFEATDITMRLVLLKD